MVQINLKGSIWKWTNEPKRTCYMYILVCMWTVAVGREKWPISPHTRTHGLSNKYALTGAVCVFDFADIFFHSLNSAEFKLGIIMAVSLSTYVHITGDIKNNRWSFFHIFLQPFEQLVAFRRWNYRSIEIARGKKELRAIFYYSVTKRFFLHILLLYDCRCCVCCCNSSSYYSWMSLRQSCASFCHFYL